ncbi:hypothetical protein [Sphingomonas sp. Leaf25]|uniref:hypothetical protein n=1 Tax=Sphingomonas sp. Leaf25 TaxID=1735692 RepID=UPI00070198C4|nr:hypothetical protein [Sphingomonas sp. Leaf25]KQN00544.1 hypothetical protein ASE78_05515 [Sphingomonas sp. Leaf25]
MSGGQTADAVTVSLANALAASCLALRSYQHGNSAPDLAASIADAGEMALHAAGRGELLHGTDADRRAAARQHGLSIEIEGGRLVIAIGIDALMTAIEGGPCAPEDLGYRIDSVDGFAAEIRAELLAEEEDGTTLVHTMFDTATEKALDAGSLSVDFDEPERDAG